MEPPKNGKKREIIAALAVLIVIVAIVAGASVANKKKADGNSSMVSSKTASSDSSTAASGSSDTSSAADSDSSSSGSTATTSSYKDGDYSATGNYDSPGGSETITVSVTLQNGVVTATSAKSGAGDPEAQEYQNDFIGGYKNLVVGKSIDSISLSRVSGSSLTSQGFNSAISKIKSSAKQST